MNNIHRLRRELHSEPTSRSLSLLLCGIPYNYTLDTHHKQQEAHRERLRKRWKNQKRMKIITFRHITTHTLLSLRNDNRLMVGTPATATTTSTRIPTHSIPTALRQTKPSLADLRRRSDGRGERDVLRERGGFCWLLLLL
jgi:hypothetical protein